MARGLGRVKPPSARHTRRLGTRAQSRPTGAEQDGGRCSVCGTPLLKFTPHKSFDADVGPQKKVANYSLTYSPTPVAKAQEMVEAHVRRLFLNPHLLIRTGCRHSCVPAHESVIGVGVKERKSIRSMPEGLGPKSLRVNDNKFANKADGSDSQAFGTFGALSIEDVSRESCASLVPRRISSHPPYSICPRAVLHSINSRLL